MAAAAAALTLAALNSSDASARPAQTTPGCSEPATETRTDPLTRPTYGTNARRLAGRRVVVHYAARGAHAPPRADRAPKNGVPDYVERVRSSADAALAFFAKPRSPLGPFQGFDTSFSDTGGPDQRLDIYITSQARPLGRAVPPTRGDGGAYVVLSKTLADRSRESKQRFKGNALRFTVAHELFHIVQFNYVQAGMPLWAGEATANALAYFFEGADHPVFVTLANEWLARPDCAMWYEGFSCDRCYGGVWWWATHPYIIRLYFEYLELHSNDHLGVGRGIGALEAAYEGLAPQEEGAFVTPYFFLDFAYTFAPSAATYSYSRTKGRPRATASIVATGAPATRRLTLNPLSAHYIAVRVAPKTRALELVTTADDGPDPLQTLLLGSGPRGKNGIGFTRQASPCVTSFLPAYATFADTVRINFASERERRQSILVVANRTNRVVHYTLSYRTLAETLQKPSVSERWTPVASLPANTFCNDDKKVTHTSGGDPAGDPEVGAPDLTDLGVSLVTTRENSRPFVAFVVDIPNRRELQTDDQIYLWIDTDRNRQTGCPGGFERLILIVGAPGPDLALFGRCKGAEMDPIQPDGSFQARFDERNRRLVVLATTSDFDGSSTFLFRFDALWKERTSNELRADSSPDDSVWCFPTCPGARAG